MSAGEPIPPSPWGVVIRYAMEDGWCDMLHYLDSLDELAAIVARGPADADLEAITIKPMRPAPSAAAE